MAHRGRAKAFVEGRGLSHGRTRPTSQVRIYAHCTFVPCGGVGVMHNLIDLGAVFAGERSWCVLHMDNRDVLPILPAKEITHTITDPPYGEHIHKSVRSSKRNGAPDVAEFACRARRVVELGFEYLDGPTRRLCAREFARITKRWIACFSDVESAHLWRLSLVSNGLDYVKTAMWRRVGGAPQFTGDRPASGFEVITLAHPKGRKEWNGGGKAGSYEIEHGDSTPAPVYKVPIVANRGGARGARIHTTQKPLELMIAIVQDFTDPGDIVLDPFCGSATTGEACLALGRKFIGIERDEENAVTAFERLNAWQQGSTIQATRAGQGALFGD